MLAWGVCRGKAGGDQYTRCYPNAKHSLLALAEEEFPVCPSTVAGTRDWR